MLEAGGDIVRELEDEAEPRSVYTFLFFLLLIGDRGKAWLLLRHATSLDCVIPRVDIAAQNAPPVGLVARG